MSSNGRNSDGILRGQDNFIAHIYFSSDPPGENPVPLHVIIEEFGLDEDDAIKLFFLLREEGYLEKTEDDSLLPTEKGKDRANTIVGKDYPE